MALISPLPHTSAAFISRALWFACAFLLAACGGAGGGGGSTTTTTTVALKAASVAAGDTHTCTSLSDKTVKCWGDNTYGQLGTDWVLPRAYNPLTVAGIANVTNVAAGAVHTCALLSNRTVDCWGSNISGQLGNGTTSDSFSPIAVSGLTNAIAITASRARLDSYGHTCALISDGTVQCWGRNIVGQLGTGNTTDSYFPITVSGLSGVTAVQAGGFHTCALMTGGTIQCWGDNALGQLGTGTVSAMQTTPVAVSGISTATALALGPNFSCALLADGTVKCWGDNNQGRLGNGTTTQSLTPVTVSGISTAIAIAAGRGHACAVLSGGTVKCWGDNSAAMLGNGTTTNSFTPVSVSGLSNAVALSAGAVHTCALLADSTVKCWGDNANAQVGPGSTTHSTTPASVLRYTPSTAITGVTAVAAGSNHGCGLINDGTVNCWGWNGSDQLGTTAFARSSTANPASGVTAATALTAGGWHNCTLQTSGTIQCWGENLNGQLGSGTFTNPGVPVTVSGIINGTTNTWDIGSLQWLSTTSTTSAVAAGSVRTCALISQQKQEPLCPGGGPCPYYTYPNIVKCWGDNDQGQLGNGTTTPSATPVNVSGITAAAAITGGYNHSCALLSGGSVQCWGANYSGQLGDGSLVNALTPTPVSGFTNAIALGDGNMGDHTCAVLADGTVRCWGDNTFGQLGNGTTTNTSTPVQVSGISTATSVAVGYGHSCARLSDNTLKCWGWNILGQLGNGTTTDSSVPVTVSGIADATAVTTGFAQSCALRSGSGVKCWGDNSYVQLGLGVLAVSTSTPTGISVVTRTTSRGHNYPSCQLALLMSGPMSCVLDGNLVIRAGGFVFVIPLPPG